MKMKERFHCSVSVNGKSVGLGEEGERRDGGRRERRVEASRSVS